jgi:hypothetical protein
MPPKSRSITRRTKPTPGPSGDQSAAIGICVVPRSARSARPAPPGGNAGARTWGHVRPEPMSAAGHLLDDVQALRTRALADRLSTSARHEAGGLGVELGLDVVGEGAGASEGADGGLQPTPRGQFGRPAVRWPRPPIAPRRSAECASAVCSSCSPARASITRSVWPPLS